jgi:phosphotransacetylase
LPGEFGPLSMMQALEVPTYPKLLWVGFSPLVKFDSVPVAIKCVEQMIKTLAKLGEEESRVALLSCVELISPNVTSTIWEATLAHMSQRGQFGKARVDGPLAMDLAISPHAVHEKGLKTEIAGEADLLIMPDLNSYITLTDLVHCTGEHRSAEIIVGGPCPVALAPHRSISHLDLSLQIASLLR